MTKRKFYKTTYVFEVLHEDPLPESISFESVVAETTDGDYSGELKSVDTVELDGKQCADALTNQDSAPEFFGLDEDGNCEFDRTCMICSDPVPEDALREHLEQHQPNARTMGIDAVESLFEPND